MAFLPKDEENQNAPTGQTTNNPQSSDAPPDTDSNLPTQGSGGSVGAGSQGPKAGSSPSMGTSTQFGSSASKLGDYLSANAPQITNQANTIANSLGNQYNQVNQDITNAANQFQQQVKGGYAASNPDVINQAKNDVTGFAKDPNNIKAFQSQYNNQYTGPQNFEGTDQYGNVQNEVNSAVQNANLLQSPAGLQSYLAGNQKNPTRASTTLDQLLLSGNPDSQAKIQNAAKQFSGLGDTFGQATTGANQSVQDAQKAAQDSQAYARGQFDPYVSQFGSDINNQTQTAQNNLNSYNQSVQNFAAPLGTIDAALRGYGGASGVSVPSDTLAQYFAMQPIQNNITAQTAATPQQAAQAQALQQLLGSNYQGPNLDPSLAGTAHTAGNSLPSSRDIAQNAANAAYLAQLQQASGVHAPNPNDPFNQLLKTLYQYDQYDPSTSMGIKESKPGSGLYNYKGDAYYNNNPGFDPRKGA